VHADGRGQAEYSAFRGFRSWGIGFPLPLYIFVPDIPPVPLRGTEATSHETLLAWHDEWNAATLAYSAASANQKVANSKEAAAKKRLDAAIKKRDIDVVRESDAIASSSAAYERLYATREKFLELFKFAHSDIPSIPSPLAPRSRMPREKGKARASASDRGGRGRRLAGEHL